MRVVFELGSGSVLEQVLSDMHLMNPMSWMVIRDIELKICHPSLRLIDILPLRIYQCYIQHALHCGLDCKLDGTDFSMEDYKNWSRNPICIHMLTNYSYEGKDDVPEVPFAYNIMLETSEPPETPPETLSVFEKHQETSFVTWF